MTNPTRFIMEYDAPFNFGMNVADWDDLYHHQTDSFNTLKPQTDPCTWTDSEKESVEAQAEYWIDKWNEYCRSEAKRE